LEWKWAEEDGVDDGEDGGVRADTKSERENGYRCKDGALCEEAEGVANVM
jgi:hypothetical protein